MEGTSHTDDEFTTFDATGRKQNMKIMLTILSTFKLIEDGIFSEWSKTLCTNKALLVPHLST